MLLLIPGDHGYFTWEEESAFLGPRPTLSSYVASHVTSRGDVITVQDSHTGSARGKWEKWEVLGKNLVRTCSFRRKFWEEMGKTSAVHRRIADSKSNRERKQQNFKQMAQVFAGRELRMCLFFGSFACHHNGIQAGIF
ncbi:hypothetical protein L798_01073 [Zootermopsis nevadensis]|uniref:Uncharacterized protein n=1 Tax=Zootermopsis nevadensis TaxID=136037 RepID=A0A067QJH2_ZOONE|nr:hypothetical protein L798_01073 [Zootermopsis nevadensis]